MKFNKVIREYMEKVLNQKRIAADKADPETVAYAKRCKAARAEVQTIVDRARNEVQEVLDRYSMDLTSTRFGDKSPASKAIINYLDQYVMNSKEAQAQRDRERTRFDKQKEMMTDIELECALGADKAKFMEMLENVEF